MEGIIGLKLKVYGSVSRWNLMLACFEPGRDLSISLSPIGTGYAGPACSALVQITELREIGDRSKKTIFRVGGISCDEESTKHNLKCLGLPPGIVFQGTIFLDEHCRDYSPNEDIQSFLKIIDVAEGIS